MAPKGREGGGEKSGIERRGMNVMEVTEEEENRRTGKGRENERETKNERDERGNAAARDGREWRQREGKEASQKSGI